MLERREVKDARAALSSHRAKRFRFESDRNRRTGIRHRASRRLRFALDRAAACNHEFAFRRTIPPRVRSSWTTWISRARGGIDAKCRPRLPPFRPSLIMRTWQWSVSIIPKNKSKRTYLIAPPLHRKLRSKRGPFTWIHLSVLFMRIYLNTVIASR